MHNLFFFVFVSWCQTIKITFNYYNDDDDHNNNNNKSTIDANICKRKKNKIQVFSFIQENSIYVCGKIISKFMDYHQPYLFWLIVTYFKPSFLLLFGSYMSFETLSFRKSFSNFFFFFLKKLTEWLKVIFKVFVFFFVLRMMFW